MPDLKRLGKYEIIEEIGRGGFATVYKARDPSFDQVVAIKVLQSALAKQHTETRRFLDEASKVVQLNHRGIVRLYAVEEDKGIPYIAMDYLPGGTLADRLRGEPLPLDGAIAVVEQVAAALDHAHRRKLVHRDVKPANILFDEEGQAVLVDFGLVKSLAESGFTTKDVLMGTPTYMSPEQANTAEVDARTDVYALGIVAYEMLTGRVPFEDDNPLAVLLAHTNESPPDLCALNKKLDKNVAAVVLKALEKDTKKRHQSAGAFARALRKAWEAVQDAAQAKDVLADLYAQLQEAMKADRWDAVMSLCIEIRNIDPDYRDVSTLLTLAAGRLIEEENKRKQEQEWEERYTAALELLEKRKYAKAIEALEKIAAQAPDFRDVGERLEQARVEQEKAQSYEAARKMLADKCYDEACTGLLALLKLDPDHADAHAHLLEATEGLLAQFQDAQSELHRVGVKNETARTRVAELEAQLKKTQVELKKMRGKLEKAGSNNKTLRAHVNNLENKLKNVQARVDAYDRLLLAMEDYDWEKMVMLAKRLAQAKLSGVNHFLVRLQAVMEKQKSMVYISAGKFLYGDEKEERELPGFWIDKTPVTNAKYARFVKATGHDPPSHWRGKTPYEEIADHPVVHVSWHDATAYAEWAGKRLPTEEEWEKAARSTDGREYPWGDWAGGRCNTKETDIRGTTPVGQYSLYGNSSYNCVDMAGNVWEWTASEWSSGSGTYVFRGGSWRNEKGDARCTVRGYYSALSSDDHRGFRCVSQVSLF